MVDPVYILIGFCLAINLAGMVKTARENKSWLAATNAFVAGLNVAVIAFAVWK